MRKLPLILVFSGLGLSLSTMASAESLTAADCRPLTQDNAQACCAAANWKKLVLSGDEELCRQSRLGLPLAAAPAITVPETPVAPGTPNPPEATTPPGTT